MKLNKYTWNNGTKSSPIVLTNDQIKKLIAIGQRKDIESKVSGYITTPSRKMQKFLKHGLESQFKDLNIICDEELTDGFTISLASSTIKEGTREFITIYTKTGITHSFLKWKYDFSNFVIDGDISEQNIKDRIRVENGYLVVNEPKENASWSVQLTLTAYPIYYLEEEFNSIPASEKSDVILNIIAKKIEDVSISTKPDVPINSKVEFSVNPVPIDSTKLKGANYSYSTTTPDIISINTSTQGTTILTKKEGTANLIVTLHACNNIITISNSTTFNVYGLRPVVFIIDQRYASGLKDPEAMVSENCVLNSDGTLTIISDNGATGNPNTNVLTWLRQNTHAYVSRNLGFKGIRLKQLSDTSRKSFADGRSAVDYISNENGEFDVFLKFGSDIYYKTESWIPKGLKEPDPDYVAVTIAKEIPAKEDANKWCKWSQYKLIGVYPACQINNKLYSLSGKRAVKHMSQIESINSAKVRGTNFNICDYDMTKLFAFLFYGYYSSLGSQQICGYGTNTTYPSAYGAYFPKITGSTDGFNMTDTNIVTGTGASEASSSQIADGIGPDIKTVNFWGLESCWGDLDEHISNLYIMEASRPENNTTPNMANYVADYIDKRNNVIVTKPTGIDVVYTSKSEFVKDYPTPSSKFSSIFDKNGNITRIVDLNTTKTVFTYAEKMIFGTHADILHKSNGNNASADTGFTDEVGIASVGCSASRSGYGASELGGISYLNFSLNANSAEDYIGCRLLYDGDENTVHVIDDATEEL